MVYTNATNNVSESAYQHFLMTLLHQILMGCLRVWTAVKYSSLSFIDYSLSLTADSFGALIVPTGHTILKTLCKESWHFGYSPTKMMSQECWKLSNSSSRHVLQMKFLGSVKTEGNFWAEQSSATQWVELGLQVTRFTDLCWQIISVSIIYLEI